MFERLKSKAFIAMLLTAITPQIVMALEGKISFSIALGGIVSALAAGLFGIVQPQPKAVVKSPLKIE
jgi:hypothetical protein